MSGPRWVEKTGRTVEEALQAALDELGVGRDRVEVEVLDEPNRGLWGFIGGRLARVRVTLRDGADAVVSDERVQPADPGAEEPAPAGQSGRPEGLGQGVPAPAGVADEQLQRAIQAKVNRGKEFLRELARLMGTPGHVETRRVEVDLYTLNLVTPDPGRLIGRHGRTLDAIQYLLNLVANRGVEGPWVRFVVDTGEYRRRREAALRALAQRTARQVRREGKSVALEPMNPLERRVIHLALRDDPSVITRSEGEEPHRRVVIQPREGDRPREPEVGKSRPGGAGRQRA